MIISLALGLASVTLSPSTSAKDNALATRQAPGQPGKATELALENHKGQIETWCSSGWLFLPSYYDMILHCLVK